MHCNRLQFLWQFHRDGSPVQRSHICIFRRYCFSRRGFDTDTYCILSLKVQPRDQPCLITAKCHLFVRLLCAPDPVLLSLLRIKIHFGAVSCTCNLCGQ